VKVAIGQVAPVVGELQANLDRTRELTTQAVAEGAKLVVFPELNLSGYFTPPQLGLAATDQRLRAATVGAGDAAVLLGFPELDNGVTYNSAALYIAGELRHVHRKLILPSYHPFTEDERFRPGNALHTFNTPFGRAAVLLCEDAVQPALATVAAHDGAELLLIPANSAHSLRPEISNREHWHAVTSFYARLTQTFVVFANRAGEEAPFRFWGGSHVLDPQGQLLAQSPQDEEALLLVELDHHEVARQRQRLPFLQNARLDVVQQELHRISPESSPASMPQAGMSA
jgi:predicted amidohydrolase